jgi:hypothetical protein
LKKSLEEVSIDFLSFKLGWLSVISCAKKTLKCSLPWKMQ